MKTYEEFKAELQERKRHIWTKLLNYDPPGRAPGNRPRDPEQERLLIRMAKRRLEARKTREVDWPG